MRGFIAQIRLRQHAGQDRTHDGISSGNTGTDIGNSSRVWCRGLGKCDCQISRSRTDNSPSDIGGKTLAGARRWTGKTSGM